MERLTTNQKQAKIALFMLVTIIRIVLGQEFVTSETAIKELSNTNKIHISQP